MKGLLPKGYEPEYDVVDKIVVEHNTKVVDNNKALQLGELLAIRCNICEVTNLYGRQNRKGEYLPDAWCPHISFIGVKRPDD